MGLTLFAEYIVAPLAGARIEIMAAILCGTTAESLPSRERGLKLSISIHSRSLYCVAPLAGARIEISSAVPIAASCSSSLPSRERGLK